MDEDGKGDQMVHACEKVEGILTAITSNARKEEEGEAGQENVIKLMQQMSSLRSWHALKAWQLIGLALAVKRLNAKS